MSSIVMPTAIQGAIQTMCADAVGQAVRALSEKYNFDLKEAMGTLSLDKLEIKTATKASGKKAVTTDKPKTKRGTTGYLMYTGELRREVTDEMAKSLADGEKLKPSQVVTELAGRWKALSDEEKAAWNEKAKAKNAADSDGESVAASSDDEHVKKETKKVVKKETKKVEKKVSDADASSAPVKKKQSGYIKYCNSIRAEVKAELEAELEEGEKLKPADTMSQLAKRWKALSDEEKAEWNEAAKTPENSEGESD
jgi:gluconate kinase